MECDIRKERYLNGDEQIDIPTDKVGSDLEYPAEVSMCRPARALLTFPIPCVLKITPLCPGTNWKSGHHATAERQFIIPGNR